MVVRITLTVKHIRGHSFQLECDRDADTLGLKVQIWEQEKISIEHQRLVFGGKELQDGIEISKCNIIDGSTLFLVETNGINNESVPVVAARAACASVDINVVSNEGNVNRYAPLDEETLSEERIKYVMNLSYWIRKYCILGLIISIISLLGCLYSIIPLIVYVCGYIGTRKLNKCCLIFPLLITLLIGIAGTMFTIYMMIEYFHPWLFIHLLITLLHVMIFICICKLLCAIKRLSISEHTMAKARIMAASRCC